MSTSKSRKSLYQMVLELKTIGGGSEAQTSARLFRPIATTRFIGRQKEIELLKAHFELRDTTGARRRDTSGARCSLLVSGMGGIGKTQLCLQFVEDAMDNSTFSRVFYVDAATEESIASSFKGIFHNTQGLKSSGLSESPDSVLAWISRLDEDWLIVYDNAEESVAKYLPGGRRGNILMTSRNPGLARHTGGAHIALDEMSAEDALALFKSSGCREFLSSEDDRLSREIVSSLLFIPLAVDLAGAYTASSSGFCDLHEYLELLSVKRTQVLNPLSIADATPYNNTIYGAWELSMKGLEDVAASSHPRQEAAESALAILQIFSFFHNSDIDENIFKKAAVTYRAASAQENDFFRPPMLSSVAQKILQLDGTKNDWDKEYFRKGIQTLLSASLIKKSTMSERVVYSVHPLIHEWVRNKHISHNRTLSQDAHIIMLSSISFDVVLYQQTITPLLPHIKAYLQYTLDIIPSNPGYNDYILERLHFFYNKASLLNEEKNILPVLNEYRKQVLGDKHPKTLAIMKEMGTWYSRQGKKEDALSTLNNTLSLMKEVYGDRGQITLDTMREIAWLYHSMEKHKDAEVMTKEVLDLQNQTLGKLHRDTLETMNNLALIYSRLGEYAKANELLTEATESTRKLLGNDHPDTLERLGNLVSLYLDQQKLDEAASILVALVDTQTRVAGEEHKDTLSSMHHLAYCLDAQGKGAEAEEIYCKVITIREKVLGNDHPDTLTSRYNLAGGYMVQGQWKKADDILVEVLEARRGVLGEENKDTLSTMHQLAHCLSEQGQMAEAEEMYSKVITLKTKALGDNHPSTLTSRHNLGSLYADKGQWEEAEAIFVPLVEALQTVLGNDHKNTLAAQQCLEIVQKRGTPSESNDDAEGIEDSSGQSGFDSDDNDEEDKDSGNTSTEEEEETAE
ncbi:TPR-like protein [Agrocybe pediades]|nr:TPR-like protein [Agrocybe pediades]